MLGNAYARADDAYRVFRNILGTGHLTDHGDEFLAEATQAQKKSSDARDDQVSMRKNRHEGNSNGLLGTGKTRVDSSASEF